MAFIDSERRSRPHGSATDLKRESPGDAWSFGDMVVIAVDGQRGAYQAIRAGKRIAARRGAKWSVAFVDTGRPRTRQTREALDRVLRFAERLGGRTVILRGLRVEAEILAYAHEQKASAIVIAQTRIRPLAGWFRQTLTQRLLRGTTDFEFIVIGTKIGTKPVPASSRRGWMARLDAAWRAPVGHYALATCVVGISILVSALLERLLPLPTTTIPLVFLIGVLIVATRTSLAAALAAAVMSSLSLAFFFFKPLLDLAIYSSGEFITVVVFLVVAFIGGNLASRLRAQVAALRATNEHSRILLDLGKQLSGAADAHTARHIAVESIACFERVPACLLASDENAAELDVLACAPAQVELNAPERAAANWALTHCLPSGCQSNTRSDIDWRFVPLFLGDARFGVLGVKLGDLPIRPGGEQLLLLDTLANQITMTLARGRLISNLQQARITEERERLRAALLSSVSHDLRTPLSSIIGAASTLRDLRDQLSATDKRELLDAIMGESQRLDRYIQNLLDMTRISHGSLRIKRDWVTLADLVAASLHRLRAVLGGLRVVCDMPDELPLLYVHPGLIEQALVNVIDNAAHFSPSGGELRIGGRQQADQLLISVTDQGPGISAAERSRVFDMFFSGQGGDSGRHHSGLGLAICRGMVEAHGGSIEALAGPDNCGTTIALRLPLHAQPEDSSDRPESSHDR